MFFIIKKLLLNGLLNDGTVLVLDEPESHLHPDWINKFAEMLVVLVENINVNVLLTTHSPNLMLALNVYARKMNVIDKFYDLNNLPQKTKLPLGEPSLGNAQIYTTINGNLPESYSISIIKIDNNAKNNKNMVIKITDEKLVKCTGGIVQGM